MSAPRAGMSLVAVLLGVTVVSFLILPLFLHFQTARAGARRNVHSLTASALASAQIEKLRRLTYRRVEALLLTQGAIEDVERDEIPWPNVIAGPFESTPERPDLVEPEAHREGNTLYQRQTFLSYFPDPNPDPDSPGFDEARRRIRVRVVLTWNEPLAGGRTSPRRFEVSTMLHDESYNPKPSLRRSATP